MKRFISMLIAMSMFLLAIPFSASAAAVETQEINTPEDYIQWLSNSPSLNSTAEQSDIIEKFKGLSYDRQQKFIDYLNDPEVIGSIYEAALTGNDTMLQNGDIKVTFKESEPKITPQATVYRASHNVVMEIFGITLISMETYVQYRVAGTSNSNLKITEILNGGAMVTRNWYPTANITIDKDSPYISANKAYQTAYYHWNFVHEIFGFQIGTQTHKVSGDVFGRSYGELTKS